MKTIFSLLLLFLISLSGNGQKYTIQGTSPDHSFDDSYFQSLKATLIYEKECVIDSAVFT